MICRYCEREIEPDSRLAHLQCCAECAAMDLVGNREQVEMGREALK